MIEYRVINLRTDLGDDLGATLTALAADRWRVSACAESSLFLTVIMVRADPDEEYNRERDQYDAYLARRMGYSP